MPTSKLKYSGDDCESHFEDLTHIQLAEIANRRGEGPTNLLRRPSGYFSGYPRAPRRQYVVFMAALEIRLKSPAVTR